MTTAQSYPNHRHQPVAWLIASLLAAAGEIAVLVAVARGALSSMTVGIALLGAALVLGLSVMRRFTTKLQDRIIRTEMQMRLAALGRVGDMPRLTTPQVIALRFAPDVELPALLDRAITEQLSGDQIKRAIVNWQGDYLRT